jgi:AcrR family transcriptional regulator
VPSPLTRRAAQNAVVAAAALVFARLGFAATRVEDILATARIARRTFYRYFEGKEDVLAALYDLATGELLADMRAVAKRTRDPLGAILHGVDTYLDYHRHNASLLRVLIAQAIRADSPLAPARRRFRAELVALLDHAARAAPGVTTRAKSRGKRGRGLDPMVYFALVSALEGLSLDLLSGPAPPSADELMRAKMVMRLLLRRTLGAAPATAR